MYLLALALRRFPRWLTSSSSSVPTNALVIGGVAITINGSYITIGG